MKNINILLIIAICFLSLPLLLGDTDNTSSNSDETTQTQPEPNNRIDGWQIFEIEYPKTPPRRTHAGSVFDGEHFHVFSGINDYKQPPLNDFWTFDPETDKWSEKKLPEFVKPRLEPTMLVKDYEIIIYGGYNIVDDKRIDYSDGYKYFFGSTCNMWEKISTENAPPARKDYTAVITDEDMIIFGGISDSDGIYHDCYAYNIDTDKWRKIEVPVSVYGRYEHAALWTGKYMLITGGVKYHNFVMEKKFEYGNSYDVPVENPVTCDQAALYNPKDDKWEVHNLHDSRAGHTSVWTGKDAILWGGYSADGKEKSWVHDTEIIQFESKMFMHSYTNKNNKIPARTSHVAYWTGKEMFVGFGDERGGDGESRVFRSGGIYDHINDNWTIPRNCPFTIFENRDRQLTFQNKNAVYNFSPYDSGVTGKYLVDKDIFYPYLGSRFQPQTPRMQLVDTPEGLFALDYHVYMNWRIMTYRYWKFNEETGLFDKIDDNRKDIQYGQPHMLYRDNKIFSYSHRFAFDKLSCKQGFMGIYNPKNNKWIKAQTSGDIPVDRKMSANVVGEDYIFVFSGAHESEKQYSEVSDVDWEERLPNGFAGLREWYPSWFDEQRKIARESNTYPVLRDGYLYSYKQNKWKPISLKEAQSPRVNALCCEFNSKFAVFGGMKREFEQQYGFAQFHDDEFTKKRLENIALFDGGIYDPKTNKWQYIRELNTYAIPYSERMFNDLRLSPIGNKLLLHGKLDRFYYNEDKDEDETRGEEFFGFLYDFDKKQWQKVEKPVEDAKNIQEVINVKNKIMLKISISDSDDDDKSTWYNDAKDYSKWFMYNVENGKWTECSLNSIVSKYLYKYLDMQRSDYTKKDVMIRKFNDKLYFYTYLPVDYNEEDYYDEDEEDEEYDDDDDDDDDDDEEDDDEEDDDEEDDDEEEDEEEEEKEDETDNPRSVLKIYSYDPSENKTKELTRIELHLPYIDDGFMPMYKYFQDYTNNMQFNSTYSRNRIVLYGSNITPRYFDTQLGPESKMVVLIYNFPEDE